MISSGKVMFWIRVRQGRRFACWKMIPMSLRGFSIGVPSMSASPAVKGCRPVRPHSRVVLPQPLGPTMATKSPSSTVMEKFCRAFTGPRSLA